MKRHLFTACLTASTLFASACQKHEVAAPKPAVRPVTAQVPRTVIPIPTKVAALGGDGGVGDTVVAKLEPIGIAHGHPGRVDHLSRAEELKGDDDLEGALQEARRAVFDDADDDDAWLTVARLSLATGDKPLSARAYHELGERLPDDAVPFIQEARVRVSMNDDEGAIGAAKDALERDDENPEVYQVLGRAKMNLGDLKGAIAGFEKAVELAPDHGYALNNLGFAYLRANENAAAVEVLTKAHDLLPDVAFVANNLGVALERMGRADDARLAYDRAMELSPKYVKARLNVERMERVASAAMKDTLEQLTAGTPDDSQTQDATPSEVGATEP